MDEQTTKTKSDIDVVQQEDRLDRMIGQVIAGRYKISRQLGVGSLAKVYEAQHLELNEAVAVKILLQDTDTESALRFRKEAETLLSLRHPSIVCVRDYGEHDHRPFLVMDLAQGKSLETLIAERGALSDQAAAKIFMQVCTGLQYAHANGILHRDLKPANIMVGGNDESNYKVQVVDFGLAKDFSHEGQTVNKMTHTGNIVGTPSYMSPEQCTGQELDQRSDIYSLGCVMYEAVSGKRAFDSNTLFDCMFKHLNDLPTGLRKLEPPVISALEPVVFKCLAKQIEGRYEELDQLFNDLKVIWEGKQLASLIPEEKHMVRSRVFAALVDGVAIWLIFAGSIVAILMLLAVLNSNKETLVTAQKSFVGLFTISGVPILIAVLIEAVTSLSLPIVSLLALSSLLRGVPINPVAYFLFGAALVSWLYHVTQESSPVQATLGKRMFGLMLVDTAYRRCGFWKATQRHCLRFLTSTAVCDLIRTFIAMPKLKSFKQAWKETMKQPMHDKLSGCLIIRRPKRKK